MLVSETVEMLAGPVVRRMKLTQIYQCFCDPTRLRILHLLTQTPFASVIPGCAEGTAGEDIETSRLPAQPRLVQTKTPWN